MATYYVRTDGSDAHAGTGSGAANAWQTIGKALGASGISSGDTVYVAPGTYREVVTVAMTPAVAETFVIADVSASQFTDLQGGAVIWTAYTTNDLTTPAASALITLNGADFLTFRNFYLFGGAVSNAANVCLFGTSSVNITFRNCSFYLGRVNGVACSGTATVDVANNWTFDSCFFLTHVNASASVLALTIPTSAVADYDAEIIFKNCLATGLSAQLISIASSGANSFKGGGVKIYDSTMMCTARAMIVNSAAIATSAGNQCEAYNNVFFGCSLNANTLGQIVEDYNFIFAASASANVTQGAHTVVATTAATYAPMFSMGQEGLIGAVTRPFFSPLAGSPFLGFGNDGSVGVQTVDAFGVPRPSGGASAAKAIGYSERGNSFLRELSTVRTGSTSISISGPGVQDFQLPVNAASTTIRVYVQWDATYAGTKPQMIVLNGEECGVATATATATGSSGAWEQLSLSITPTRTGIVTIRFQSNDTNGAGKMFVDDFSTP